MIGRGQGEPIHRPKVEAGTDVHDDVVDFALEDHDELPLRAVLVVESSEHPLHGVRKVVLDEIRRDSGVRGS